MAVFAWPSLPYKGFSYYTRNDVPLFAGREDDTLRCARFLADWGTRILVLQGSTGCGKSSFLRAGLIPFLETGDRGFRFIRSGPQEQSRAVFVRATDAPLCRLSECLFDFISRPLELLTPHGLETIHLTNKVASYPDCSSFCDHVAASVDEMLSVLHKLAKAVPQTLVLIIDQAEEVLTVKPGADGSDSRSRFFDFLTRFYDMGLDIKLLIAIRTEYKGRFDNEIQNRTGDVVTIPHYLLTDFSEGQIVQAIERPTLHKDIEGYGSPYSHYKFSYEEGLPEKIATDLVDANPRGGILPVLQIVCDRLYRAINSRRQQPGSEMIISVQDYLQLGGIEGQVDAYVTEMLAMLCREQGISSRGTQKEIERWKEVLYLLTREQLDGTATTQIKSEDELREAAAKQFCRLDFDKTMEYLSEEEQRVIRREKITNIAKRQRVVCYSLGHDAIGLALHKWKIAQDEKQIYLKRLIQIAKAFGRSVLCSVLFGLGVLCMLVTIGLIKEAFRPDHKPTEDLFWAAVFALLSWPFFYGSRFLPWIRRVIGGVRRRWFQRERPHRCDTP